MAMTGALVAVVMGNALGMELIMVMGMGMVVTVGMGMRMGVGNTTLIIGTDDDKTAGAIDILKRYCTTRKQMVSSATSFGLGMKHLGIPEEIKVGGATIFVLDVTQMEKI